MDLESNKPAKIVLANPRGFCAGVERAIEIVNRALKLFGEPIYVHNEVVHNQTVVNSLRQRGAVFVQNLDEVPNDSYLIFSAHGVSLQIRRDAKKKGLKIFDATCPLVTKVHLQMAKFARQGRSVILIGHAGHPEVEGTLGQYQSSESSKVYLVETVKDAEIIRVTNSDNLAYVTQTTLSVDDTREIVNILRTRFPNIDSPKREDICYATQNRQNAIEELCKVSDLILVVGSPNSSNSNRLAELALKLGINAHLIDNVSEIDDSWFEGVRTVGIASGASAPEMLVRSVHTYLTENHSMVDTYNRVRTNEKIKFPLPLSLRIAGQKLRI